MQKDAHKLLEKYKAGNCTEKEKAIVESWYMELQSEEHTPAPKIVTRTKEEVWAALSASTGKPVQKIWYTQLPGVLKWAAVLFIVVSVGIVYLNVRDNDHSSKHNFSKNNDVIPGGNKAFLTLADGRKISLTDAANGELVKQEGLVIKKTAEGQLVYTLAEAAPGGDNGAPSFNTIETPKGGKYQINLPDGTRVWLNAASSLRYPTQFKGTRTVELSGEGYFEVAKLKDNTDKRIPFVVKSRGQEVEVLGTHFNINSYSDEADVKTTLVEGAVKVIKDRQQGSEMRNAVILKPGEQSQLTEKSLNVKYVDAEAVLAWKDGDFLFDGEDLKSIMRKVSRWYDVEVTYKGEFDNLKFGGLISRSKNISSVLGIMESTGRIHFVIEGKRVTVVHNEE